MDASVESIETQSWFDRRTSATSTGTDTTIVGTSTNIDLKTDGSVKQDQESEFSHPGVDPRAARDDGVSTFKSCAGLV
ncbi:hypothetical protein BGZ74_005020 [Mortierella antarctica]|nr:hypothetical protein BGZ74_005020 [Mortierella antarctica]